MPPITVSFQQRLASPSDLSIPFQVRHFLESVKTVEKSVSNESLEKYKKWANKNDAVGINESKRSQKHSQENSSWFNNFIGTQTPRETEGSASSSRQQHANSKTSRRNAKPAQLQI